MGKQDKVYPFILEIEAIIGAKSKIFGHMQLHFCEDKFHKSLSHILHLLRWYKVCGANLASSREWSHTPFELKLPAKVLL